MRTILEPLQALGLIPCQPGMQGLTRHPFFDATCEIDKPSLMTAHAA
jgi:hypothetical protein